MKEIINTKIDTMIYEIRGKQVMLDSDLARIYQCSNGTKTINQAVNRHIERFPEDFYFRLNKDEFDSICSPRLGPQKNMIRYLPYAFTEQGIAMLATVLRTHVAAEVSISIMRAFVRMRHYINFNRDVLPNRVLLLENRVDNNTKMIQELFDRFDPKVMFRSLMFFKGEFYDAYSALLEILSKASKEIIITDNYAGKELLDIIKKIDVHTIIISCNIDDALKKKYEKQYSNVTFINNNEFHDRFIILDSEKIYTCGSSLKDLGKKCFIVTEIEDKIIKDALLNKLKELFN